MVNEKTSIIMKNIKDIKEFKDIKDYKNLFRN